MFHLLIGKDNSKFLKKKTLKHEYVMDVEMSTETWRGGGGSNMPTWRLHNWVISLSRVFSEDLSHSSELTETP